MDKHVKSNFISIYHHNKQGSNGKILKSTKVKPPAVVVCNKYQLGCIITLKPFDDHHNHREHHEQTRNVVFTALQVKNMRTYRVGCT